jgi:DNA helicase II / ATP-dependent DNA helicase PcrA
MSLPSLSTLVDGLNPQQRHAVEAKDGPTLVIAGPGSGKTRVLTSRVAYLIAVRDVFPFRIMAVTFTNKAAREMRERLNRLVGTEKTNDVMLGTFHSICARVLRRAAATGELTDVDRNFTIYDADDQNNVVKAALAEMNLDDKKFKPQAIHNAISTAKNELITPEDYRPDTYFNEIAGRVYTRYNQILRANNALDFDDLLMESVLLLRNNASTRERLQERYAHILIDEFQDTNIAQYRLVQLLSGKHRNLYAVGDPDQSVYAWRGADYRNVLRLREDYPELKVIALEQNYRSTQTILDAAMAVIKKNANRQHINLFTQREGGPKIAVRELFNEDEEGQYVVDTIAELIRQKAAAPGEIAVMYRTNAQSRAVEDAFVRAGLPYKLVGATRFYARREVKDALAYLRIVNNPLDTVSLSRVINTPTRGIGEKSFAQLEAAARAGNMSCLDVITQSELSGRAAKALKDFGAMWQQWIALRDELSVGQLFDQIVKASGYRDHLLDGSEEGDERWANVMELRNVAGEAGDVPLSDFLNDIALVSETDNLEAADAPTLLTLHAAKGLEFKVVFIVGLVDGVLPHQRSLDDPEQMSEERRLMYVGITRAKDRLYLLRPFRRSQWGMSDAAEPSRFLADLPDTATDAKPRKNAAVAKDVTTWKPQTKERVPPQDTLFKPGDRVSHPKFGDGIVLKSAKLRDDEEVEIFFPGVGGKRLSASLSGIKKAGGRR